MPSSYIYINEVCFFRLEIIKTKSINKKNKDGCEYLKNNLKGIGLNLV